MALSIASFGAPASALASDPAPFVEKLSSEGERNRVLNEMEVGTRYFWLQENDKAASAFDDAITNIELVFRNDPSVTQARSLWYEEGSKKFKGEPYERAMAYYYRGLLYLETADYENARAAFRQGQMQDAFAEEQQNQSDFALLLYLEAWASHLNGDTDLADEALARAHKLRPECPGFGKKDNTLVLIETGTAPRKLGDGADHGYFVYRRGKGFNENRAEIVKGDTLLPLFPIEDIYFQASTRGGREVDAMLEGKVRFKHTTGDIGSGLADGATIASQLGVSGALSGTLGAVGAISLLISSKAKPRADTRAWSSLPDHIHIASFPAAALPAAGPAIRFMVDQGPSDMSDQVAPIHIDPKGNRLVLLRSRLQ